MTRVIRVIRTTGWIASRTLVLCLGLFAAPPARACWQCDGIACVGAEGGARACFYGVGGCVTFGSCGDRQGSGERTDAEGAMALQLTWIETGAAPNVARVARGAGRRAFGANALRALRAATGEPVSGARVVAAVAGLGERFEVALRDDAGDGVLVAWTAGVRGGRVTIRPLAGRAPGPVVADERLADSDALVVPVRHGGAGCALVVQPRVLPRLSVRLETEDMARTARDAARPGRPRLAIEAGPAVE